MSADPNLSNKWTHDRNKRQPRRQSWAGCRCRFPYGCQPSIWHLYDICQDDTGIDIPSFRIVLGGSRTPGPCYIHHAICIQPLCRQPMDCPGGQVRKRRWQLGNPPRKWLSVRKSCFDKDRRKLVGCTPCSQDSQD